MLHRTSLRALVAWSAACILGAVGAHRAAAQGGNVDIVSGAVYDQSGKPVPNTVIEGLSIETDVTRRTTSDTKGRYTLTINVDKVQKAKTAADLTVFVHDAVRKILTDLQWSLLPDFVQNPSANFTGPAPGAGGSGWCWWRRRRAWGGGV